MSQNKKLVINTGVLFIRVILTLIISLLSTRFVLKALGEQDFGIYNLIAGIVALLSFLSTSLSTSTQRFISYEQGLDGRNVQDLRNVVGCSVSIHIWASILMFTIIILGGCILIKYVLNIPEGKFLDAYYVLSCVAFALVGTLLSVPLEAMLLAHENITFYAICQLTSSSLRLLAALCIPMFGYNHLLIYSILTAFIPYLILLTEYLYCRDKYEESRYLNINLRTFSSPLGRRMMSYISYSSWGTMGWAIRSQGFSIILNIFWGVLVNAANGIANQVSHAITTFSNSLTTSLRPQLVQSIASNNDSRAQELIRWSCKFPALLVAAMVLPIFVTLQFLLEIWLTEVPEWTIDFCRILLLSLLINQSTVGLCMYLDAIGAVKKINVYTGFSLILFTILAYCFGYMSKSPVAVYSLLIINDLLISIFRIKLGCTKGLISYHVFYKILLSLFFICFITYVPTRIIWGAFDESMASFLVTVLVSIAVFMTCTYLIGLNESERTLVKTFILRLKNKI